MTKEMLRKHFTYHPDGYLIWEVPTSNRIKKGGYFGTPHSAGYRTGSLLGKRSYQHILIWVYHNGPIPDGFEIDHKDRDRANDKISNLRAISKTHNVWNSTYKSCYYDKRTQKWCSRVMVNGIHHWLGRHKTEAEAIRVSAEFKLKYQKVV